MPEDPAVRVAFSGRTRDGGRNGNVSLLVGSGDVPDARRDLLSMVGATLSDAVFMEQVHGGKVTRADRRCAGAGAAEHATAVAASDALVTTDEDLALVVMVADCVPVILVDPSRGVAAVHAGRGGVEAGIVPAAVRAVAPADPSGVVALIGPAIGGCCYEVPQAMADTLAGAVPAAAATTTWGTPSLDLPAAVRAQLLAAGVARVERVAGCTRCDDRTWFSHRSATGGDSEPGRQAGVVLRAGAAAPHRAALPPSLESS